MSPQYQGVVYGEPEEAFIPLMKGEGWGPKTLTLNNTVKIYGTEKMDWRGECFLITGHSHFVIFYIRVIICSSITLYLFIYRVTHNR